ncbi:tail fiber domain-containing protein [Chitinophaga niabensis]|uniref:Chaperone of endosialidase n=1 Tax=Chitinophaga niabensis TaxID=536979 RepID=A0A1N6DEV8_9BACT|nr:tail fiber domain-containing protein [Chitinophaga niabensis]SIN69247.1 Chaperone of endosialidase [Chitinophaga niabensis]
MKHFVLSVLIVFVTQLAKSQHVYQIRADSVRIYNVCDTAELIIENRTRGVAGFLYNKGNGRTEFRRLQLESIGGNQIAISGQDTLDISTLPGIGGVDTIYRDGNYIKYNKRGTTYSLLAPVSEDNLQTVTSRGSITNQRMQIHDPVVGPDTYTYAPFGITRAAVAGNLSYWAMTKSGTIVYGAGINTANEMIMGQVFPDLTVAPSLYVRAGGMIGVNKSPSHALDVNGNIRWNGYNIGNPRAAKIGFSGGDYGGIGYGLDFTSSTNEYKYDAEFNGDNPTLLRFNQGFDFLTAPTGTPGNLISFTTLARFATSAASFNVQLDVNEKITSVKSNTLTNGLMAYGNFEARSAAVPSYGFHIPGIDGVALYYPGPGTNLRVRSNGGRDGLIWTSDNHGTGSGMDADLLDGFHASVANAGSTVAVRNADGYLFSNYFNTSATTEGTIPTRIFGGTEDGYIRPLAAGAIRSFLGMPASGETLQSVTDRSNYTTNNIQFVGGSGNPSTGLLWGYNTDYWKIFVESPQDTPSGNMIFESGDNDNEGWIFRSAATSGGAGVTDILSVGRDRLNYQGFNVWHAGSLSRPIGQSLFRLMSSDGTSANDFQQGSTFSYASGSPYSGPLLSFGGLNGNYDCQINADYGTGNNIAFRVRNGDGHVWNAWQSLWHSGNVTFNTSGYNVALKTEYSGTLGLDNWVRVANATGMYTTNGKNYLYNNTYRSWAIRGESDSQIWFELQTQSPTGGGVNRGGIYANSSDELGFVNADANGWRLRTDASGNAYVTGMVQATSFYQTSLRSLKKDIQPFDRSALAIMDKVQVRSFIFKADKEGKTNIGFIADEVPDEISTPGRKGVDQASTVALLVKSVQELNAENKELAGRVKELESLVHRLLNEKKN